MNVQHLIELLQDYPPHAEVKIALDAPIGKVKSVFEGPIERVENVNGAPFLIGEVRD